MLTLAVCFTLLGGAAGVNYLIFASEPTAQSEAATRRSAALVETIAVSRGDYRPRLDVLGLVEPARDVVLSPRVSGQIIGLEDAFVPGGLVEEGQKLLEIDPADFKRVLTARMSEMKQVEANLAIEQGRQIVARQEFELLGAEIDPENRALVLREPQIESIRAQLEAAKAAVEQAQLDLDRTEVRAPFDAQILNRMANVGSQVSPGDALGRLVGIDEYWVMASVPLRDLRWLTFPKDGQEGSRVLVRQTTAWAPGVVREASVSRLIGNVDQETRLARVLVTVPDPLARETDAPPMILGTIVELQIEGRQLEDVIRLDRAYLRQNDTVWVMVDDALQIRSAEVVFRDARFAYIRSGIDEGEQVVTTSLATVTEGLPLRRAEEEGGEIVEATR
ncbi:MAG: efflux RND transporter periplasmic adaptor subunit [Planctomycetota bacterium]|nr:efflux RND transporter periplasmic adaptor subunit [Planctomycetota bacterium]